MSEGIIAFLVIIGLIAMSSLVDYIDKRKPKLKGVQPKVEVYKKKKDTIKKISA